MTQRFGITSSQFAFITAVRPHLSKSGLTASNTCKGESVSFTPLAKAAKAAGYAATPLWCMSAERKVGRGVYAIPELFADDSRFDVREVKRGRKPGSASKPKAKAKAVERVAPVAAPAPAPAVAVASAASLEASDSKVALARFVTNGEADSFVPTKDPNYVHWGHSEEIQTILKSGLFAPSFITGLSGNGKTTMVEQVAADLGREVIRMNFTSQTDEDDLIGGFRLFPGGETKFVPGPVLVAMERGAILLLDEVDLASHLVMCLQSVLEGKGKFIPKIGKFVRPAPGFTVFATANTKGRGDSDGKFVGTNFLNEAFLERFDFTYEQEYAPVAVERKILKKYAKSLGVDDKNFMDCLVSWADIIRKAFTSGVVNDIITTRRLLHIVKAYHILGDKMIAIDRCISRFDAETKEAFKQMYTKIDAEAVPVGAGEGAADAPQTDATTDPNNTKCPF